MRVENQETLGVRAKLAEARDHVKSVERDVWKTRPGYATILRLARENLTYWERRLQEMLAGG